MISWDYEIVLIFLGLFAALILFWRIPVLPRKKSFASSRLSIIIPARNEVNSLPLLLSDLAVQSLVPYEIIVVNDNSDDETESAARTFPVTVLSSSGKPEGWVGKNWACHLGALAATGDSFLFLDADVRLAPDGLSQIAAAYKTYGIVSIQPYHMTQRWHEQFALIFNLIQVGANGSALPQPINLGLFGPIIAISREQYFAIGGHEKVKSSVVEDMSLADHLRAAKISYRIFIGNRDVTFRMYPDGFHSLWQGFSKNLATGAAKTPVWMFLLIALFIASVTSAALRFVQALALWNASAFFFGALYLLWVFLLFFISRRIGRFRLLAFLLYPVPLAVFFAVFLNSFLIRLFHRKVKWKGRAIELDH